MNTTKTTIMSLGTHTGIAALAAASLSLATPQPASADQRVYQIEAEQGQSSHHSTYTVSDGDHEIHVVSDGKTATVNLDGRRIATLSLDDDWRAYEVLDADGEVVATVVRSRGFGASQLAVHTGKEHRLGWTFERLEAPDAPDAPDVSFAPRALAFATDVRPRVMIGIYAESSDNIEDEVLAALDLDAGQVTYISQVADDGPAAKAGLQAGDIITKISGHTSGDLKTLREELHEREPGETLDVVVLRDGHEQRFTLELEAYDQTFFGPAPNVESRFMGQMDWLNLHSEINKRSMELAELSEKLARAKGAEARKVRAEMEERGRALAELSRELAESKNMNFFTPESQVEVQVLRGTGEGNRIVLEPRVRSHLMQEEYAEMIASLKEELADEIAAIDDRMDELDERIDRRLNELVDELLRRIRER